jgi:hypothetical protein
MLASYHETLKPWVQADESAVTLTTSNQALVPVQRYNEIATQFFDTVGKKLWLHASGKMSTSTSPGTLTLALLWGNGANANGTSLVASAAQTLIASQSNISWVLDLYIHCRAVGTSGSLFVMGEAIFGTALIAAGTFLIPASAPAAVGSLDLTSSNVPSLQALVSSGSSITMTVQDFALCPMN